jgi:hypothetical protein
MLHFPFNEALGGGGSKVDIRFIEEDGKRFNEKIL